MKSEELITLRRGSTFTCRVDCAGYKSWLTFTTYNCAPDDVFCADMLCDDFHDMCDDPYPCSCMSGGSY